MIDDFSSHRVSSIMAPDTEQPSIWRAFYAQQGLHVDSQHGAEGPVDIEATMRALPDLRTAIFTISPAQAAIRATDQHAVILLINIDGTGEVSQCGRKVALEPGDATLLSSKDDGWFVKSCSRWMSVAVPAEALSRRTVMYPRHAVARRIPSDTAPLRLLSGYLQTAMHQLTSVAPRLQHCFTDHVHELIALTVAAIDEDCRQEAAKGPRAANLRRLLAEMEVSFANPAFTPIMAANRLKLSIRYIQYLMKEAGTSFTRRLLELRLQEARRLLASLTGERRSISDISRACGFNDVSTFSRSFRRRFGGAPTAFRPAVTRGSERHDPAVQPGG